MVGLRYQDTRSLSAGLVLEVWGRFRISCLFDDETQGCMGWVFSGSRMGRHRRRIKFPCFRHLFSAFTTEGDTPAQSVGASEVTQQSTNFDAGLVFQY